MDKELTEGVVLLTGKQAKIGAFVCGISAEVFREAFLHHGDKAASLGLSHAEHIKHLLEANPSGATLNQFEAATLAGYTSGLVKTFAFIINGLTGKEPNLNLLADAWSYMTSLASDLDTVLELYPDEKPEGATE